MLEPSRPIKAASADTRKTESIPNALKTCVAIDAPSEIPTYKALLISPSTVGLRIEKICAAHAWIAGKNRRLQKQQQTN